MGIIKKDVGIFNNTRVSEYTFSNAKHTEITIISFGATVKSIKTPDRNGNIKNILMGFDNWESYVNNHLYSGASVAPVSGRIANGIIKIDGKEYQLSKNDGENILHGGFQNASFSNWEEESITEDSLTLKIKLADGLDGFPGNREVFARFTLTEDNEFTMQFTGYTDAPTYLVLTNHNYINLSGDFTTSALKMSAQINADKYVANDEHTLGISFEDVSKTPFDFRTLTTFEENINKYPDDLQIKESFGYDHPFAVNGEGMRKMIRLESEETGRVLEISSTAPAVVIYSGGFIGNEDILHGGVRSSDSCAIAVEPQQFPNSPYLEGAEYLITDKDTPYSNTIKYKFSTM